MARSNDYPKRHLDQFSRFRMGIMNELSVGKKTPKIARSLGIASTRRGRTEPRPWATCTIGKDRACVSGDMLADRHTHTITHTYALITILRHRSRGRSNNNRNIEFFLK